MRKMKIKLRVLLGNRQINRVFLKSLYMYILTAFRDNFFIKSIIKISKLEIYDFVSGRIHLSAGPHAAHGLDNPGICH